MAVVLGVRCQARLVSYVRPVVAKDTGWSAIASEAQRSRLRLIFFTTSQF
jgi:hypothetical protein